MYQGDTDINGSKTDNKTEFTNLTLHTAYKLKEDTTEVYSFYLCDEETCTHTVEGYNLLKANDNKAEYKYIKDLTRKDEVSASLGIYARNYNWPNGRTAVSGVKYDLWNAKTNKKLDELTTDESGFLYIKSTSVYAIKNGEPYVIKLSGGDNSEYVTDCSKLADGVGCEFKFYISNTENQELTNDGYTRVNDKGTLKGNEGTKGELTNPGLTLPKIERLDTYLAKFGGSLTVLLLDENDNIIDTSGSTINLTANKKYTLRYYIDSGTGIEIGPYFESALPSSDITFISPEVNTWQNVYMDPNDTNTDVWSKWKIYDKGSSKVFEFTGNGSSVQDAYATCDIKVKFNETKDPISWNGKQINVNTDEKLEVKKTASLDATNGNNKINWDVTFVHSSNDVNTTTVSGVVLEDKVVDGLSGIHYYGDEDKTITVTAVDLNNSADTFSWTITSTDKNASFTEKGWKYTMPESVTVDGKSHKLLSKYQYTFKYHTTRKNTASASESYFWYENTIDATKTTTVGNTITSHDWSWVRVKGSSPCTSSPCTFSNLQKSFTRGTDGISINWQVDIDLPATTNDNSNYYGFVFTDKMSVDYKNVSETLFEDGLKMKISLDNKATYTEVKNADDTTEELTEFVYKLEKEGNNRTFTLYRKCSDTSHSSKQITVNNQKY